MGRPLSHQSLSFGFHKLSRYLQADTNICCVMPLIHAIPGKLKERSTATLPKLREISILRGKYITMSRSIVVSILGSRFSLSFSPSPSVFLFLFQQCGIQYECEAWTAAILLAWGKHREESRELDQRNWNHLPDCASPPISILTYFLHVNNILFYQPLRGNRVQDCDQIITLKLPLFS